MFRPLALRLDSSLQVAELYGSWEVGSDSLLKRRGCCSVGRLLLFAIKNRAIQTGVNGRLLSDGKQLRDPFSVRSLQLHGVWAGPGDAWGSPGKGLEGIPSHV